MTLDFFYNNYTIDDLNINSIMIKDNKLIIEAYVSTHLELIANGYRPELDVSNKITFEFEVNSTNKKYIKPIIKDIKYDNEKLYLYINDDEIIITNNNIVVHKN